MLVDRNDLCVPEGQGMKREDEEKALVVGPSYVGEPLAIELSKTFRCTA